MNGDHNPAGALSGALANGFAPLPSSRASPFPATSATAKMTAPAFMAPVQSFRMPATSQAAYSLLLASANSFDRDATQPLGTPFSTTPAALTSALIRKLPLNTADETLRLMLVFSKDLAGVEILPIEQSEDPGFRSAILKFHTLAGAQEAKNMLDGKSNHSNDAEMIVEIRGSSPTAPTKRYTIDTAVPTGASTNSSSASSTNPSRQATRFNGPFQSMDRISPPLTNVYTSADLTSSEPYSNMFSPQSPIGNHLTDRTRISGKSLINNDSVDDDDTGELLKDPVGFAENGLQRRQTAPHIPISRMATLSLNTNPSTGPSQMTHYGQSLMTTQPGHSSTMSPTVMGGAGPGMGFGQPSQPYRPFPPANPADQNPPCNTLYVGNLPIDTSEEELKAMFSKQRGYKRLCFRTKQNGPMCFVEFEDISFATKALNELYGQPLHNSIKGGIRLSFSKNPLGVRSGQAPGQSAVGSVSSLNGMHSGPVNGFTTANGPPPGLSAPPGLGMTRSAYSPSPNMVAGRNNPYASPAFPTPSNNPWNPVYNAHTVMVTGVPSGYHPNMMGR
ncbi:hypothetical protein B0T26DRAFT_38431 [Lasiosphaeria miniovina]|uniref:RRM domain-containing protein n=1 Tax=Lasiosphaeria miniovina TaxID=1954250 RepID=A0AA40BGJ6_9PEZI|nr:uncharacterized protein B0T26DRAFT_38431 [Lasiosphaeria miniovina]KAK0733829.1 hypothetical protein B0T26DRAFT_38431 [Lasiosphaeria miniovina]